MSEAAPSFPVYGVVPISRTRGPRAWKPGTIENRPGAEMIARQEFWADGAFLPEYEGMSREELEAGPFLAWAAYRAWEREQAARAYLGLRKLPFDLAEWLGRF